MSSKELNESGQVQDNSDLKVAQDAFEAFILSSPYLNNLRTESVQLKNTFIEVKDTGDSVTRFMTRSSTAPADISDEILQLARTITRDLPLMATIVESLEPQGNYDFDNHSPSNSTQASNPRFVPIVATTLIPEDADMTVESNYTTVMLRNIPNKYTQPTLLQAINANGFDRLYNFFYLPVDYKNHCNMGYAFINFVDHSSACSFMDAFRGYQLPAKSSKVCDTCWARVQGLKSNVEHYRNSPVNKLPDPEYRPLIFQHGTEVAFPRPDSVVGRTAMRRRSSPNVSEHTHNRKTPPGISPSAGFAESNASVKLFIGGLSVDTREEDIREHFSQFGTVVDASVVVDKKSGESRGFGFCSLAEHAAGERVVAKRQHIINGQSVGVRFYQPNRQ
jgi:RNA recognition motif-containing protein